MGAEVAAETVDWLDRGRTLQQNGLSTRVRNNGEFGVIPGSPGW